MSKFWGMSDVPDVCNSSIKDGGNDSTIVHMWRKKVNIGGVISVNHFTLF